MHQRISVNTLCFPGTPLAVDIDRWRRLGARQIGVQAAKLRAAGWDQGVGMLRVSGFKIATIVYPLMMQHRLDENEWVEAARPELSKTLAAASTLRAQTVYMTTGGRGALDWIGAARRFADAIAPCAREARELGIQLLIETASPLYADIHIAHTLRDTLRLAEIADIGVCIDIFSCWTEADLRASIRRAIGRCHLVQLSDYVLGDRALSCRAVPGDGAIPLERIIGWILEDGFKGVFDLELIGPRIDKEGHYEAVSRSCEWLSILLDRIGA